MNYRILGKSGLKVSEMSYGSWVTFSFQIGVESASKIMKHALDKGVNFFDNAPHAITILSNTKAKTEIESDFIKKFKVANSIVPIAITLFANSVSVNLSP